MVSDHLAGGWNFMLVKVPSVKYFPPIFHVFSFVVQDIFSWFAGTGSGSGGAGGGGGSGGGGGGGSGVGGVSQGAGGGAGGRRLFSDMPAHVQHLLEERQHFERVSPSRRTVYRKIVSGMQGSANPSMAYHLSGTVCYDNYVSEVQVYYSLIIIHISVMIYR